MVTYGFQASTSDENSPDDEAFDLHDACAAGDVTLVRAFLMGACNCHRASEEQDPMDGHNPIPAPIDDDRTDVISVGLEERRQSSHNAEACNCRTLLADRDSLGRTPLRVAVDNEQIAVVDMLMKEYGNHLDVDTRDDRGWTPLASACAFVKDVRMLRLLVDGGGDLNWKHLDGSKLKDLAIRMGNQTAVEYIQRQWEDQVGKQFETTANKFPAIECEKAVTTGDIDTLVTPDSWAAGGHHDVVDQFNNNGLETCTICECSDVDVTLVPCEHRACDACSRRWKRCHVTLAGSICGITCGSEIRGRRKILTFDKKMFATSNVNQL